uniref:Uncharacterized protein n=2 Tax=unclassified Caudoviricetes TaxID=2788787 RepID=A0A8S5PM62_9CAUD|nr:MAG TPA: hypothetical protein [Siphoviridae sp. ctOSJ35]DAE16028.1 MAG TPA: hypothetical protein [Siphoviridae sp. ctIOF8]DAK06593.1 MAG TPA: hypothetical protein [Caudoviricetes sp.]
MIQYLRIRFNDYSVAFKRCNRSRAQIVKRR